MVAEGETCTLVGVSVKVLPKQQLLQPNRHKEA